MHHLYMTCHQKAIEVKDREGKRVTASIEPSLGGMTSQGVIGKCDIIANFDVIESGSFNKETRKTTAITKHIAWLAPHPVGFCGIRAPSGVKVPSYVENPTFKTITAFLRRPKGEAEALPIYQPLTVGDSK